MPGFVSVRAEEEMTEQEIQALIDARLSRDYRFSWEPFVAVPTSIPRTVGWSTTASTILQPPSLIPTMTGGGANRMVEYALLQQTTDTAFENARGSFFTYHFSIEFEMWAAGFDSSTSYTGLALNNFSSNPAWGSTSNEAVVQLRVVNQGPPNYSSGVDVQLLTSSGDGSGGSATVQIDTLHSAIDPYFKLDWNPFTKLVTAYYSNRAGGGYTQFAQRDITTMMDTISGGFSGLSGAYPVSLFITSGTQATLPAFEAFFRNPRITIIDYFGPSA